MKFDSYPRFLKSDVYRHSLVADLEGVPLPGEEGEEERKSRGSFFWKVSHPISTLKCASPLCSTYLGRPAALLPTSFHDPSLSDSMFSQEVLT